MTQFSDKIVEPKQRRYAVIDIARGVALIGVVLYHLCWDLRFFGFLPVGVENMPVWLISQRILLGSFMVLTGASIVLAHGNGLRARAFLRRFGILLTASFAVSMGTYLLFPGAFVYFGVLHAIALFSLLLLPFLRAPNWVGFLVGFGFVVAAALFQSPAFNAPALSWIGFYTVPPLTNDLVPIFPWFGIALLGLVGMRLVLASPFNERLLRFAPTDGFSAAMTWAGRWSLIIYLVHQPVLIGVIMPAANYFQPGAETRVSEFLGSCRQSCELGSGEAGYCERYCGCSLEQIEGGNLWELVSTPTPTLDQSKQISSITNLCTVMARE